MLKAVSISTFLPVTNLDKGQKKEAQASVTRGAFSEDAALKSSRHLYHKSVLSVT